MVRSNLASQSESKNARLIAARRLKRKELMDAHKEKPFSIKDVSGYVWVLIPSVLASMQISRLANGSGNVALALASAIDIRTLVMGIFLLYTPSFALLVLIFGSGHIRKSLGRLDPYGAIVAIIFLSLLVLWCVAYATIFVGTLTVLVSGFIVVRIAIGRSIAYRWASTSALIFLAIAIIFAVGISFNQVLPTEVLKIKTGQQVVGYVINPNQGGWATVLPIAQNGNIYRFESSSIASRTLCEERLSKWETFYRTRTLTFIIDHRHLPFCPD